MSHYRPTYASAEDLFASPPEERPFVDLNLYKQPGILPVHCRRPNTGVTRFANLIIGLAVDGARRRNVGFGQMLRAFEVGQVVARLTVYPCDPALPDEHIQPIHGEIVIDGRDLQVTGGYENPDAKIDFVRRNDLWLPRRSEFWVAGQEEPRVTDIQAGASFSEPASGNAGRVPDEFLAAARLGELEELITGSHPNMSLRGDFPRLASR